MGINLHFLLMLSLSRHGFLMNSATEPLYLRRSCSQLCYSCFWGFTACDDVSHTYYDGSCYIYIDDSKPFVDHMTSAADHTGGKVVSINNEAEARYVCGS